MTFVQTVWLSEVTTDVIFIKLKKLSGDVYYATSNQTILSYLKNRMKIFRHAEMTPYWFSKMAGFPKLLGIFEFRKKQKL